MPASASVLIVLAAFVLVSGVSDPAEAAAADSFQEQIDDVLERFPGGVQTGPTSVEWDGGAVELVFAHPTAPGVASVGSCATGAYCAFNLPNLGGTRLSLTTCGTTVSTAALPGSVQSIANARATGSVQARNGSGTTLATVAAGGQLNVAPSGITHLRCSP